MVRFLYPLRTMRFETKITQKVLKIPTYRLNPNHLFQLQYFLAEITEKFVPIDSPEFEMCRLQLTNSTELQLRHSLAALCSDIQIVNTHNIAVYDTYISNGGFLWPVYGKPNLKINQSEFKKSEKTQ